jgi:hypothetical protein
MRQQMQWWGERPREPDWSLTKTAREDARPTVPPPVLICAVNIPKNYLTDLQSYSRQI